MFSLNLKPSLRFDSGSPSPEPSIRTKYCLSPDNRDELYVFRREGLTGGEESSGLDFFDSMSSLALVKKKIYFLLKLAYEVSRRVGQCKNEQ